MTVADVRALFPALDSTIHLDMATMALGRTPVRAAYEAALGIFTRLGAPSILARNADLSRRLQATLQARLPAFRPFPPQHRSTIVSLRVNETEAVAVRLLAVKEITAIRAGRLCLSLRVFNLEQELDRVVEIITGADGRMAGGQPGPPSGLTADRSSSGWMVSRSTFRHHEPSAV